MYILQEGPSEALNESGKRVQEGHTGWRGLHFKEYPRITEMKRIFALN